MDVPPLEVGYSSATTGRRGHEVHKGHVVAMEIKYLIEVRLKNHSSIASALFLNWIDTVALTVL
jgi:hypothetical protein